MVSTPFAGVVVYDERRSCPFFSSMISIACLSYRITPLNITSCGCRVQTYGVRDGVRQPVESFNIWDLELSIFSYMVPCPSPRTHYGRFIGLHKMIISKSPNCEATAFYFQQSSSKCTMISYTQYMHMGSRILNFKFCPAASQIECKTPTTHTIRQLLI